MNTISENDTRVCAECYYIIKNLNKQYQEKIPSDFIKEMYEIMDKSYNVDLKKGVLPDTKSFLALIMRKYFQNDKFNRAYDSYVSLELNSSKNNVDFNNNIFGKNNKNLNKDIRDKTNIVNKWDIQQNENMQLVEYKENIIKKILGFFKKMFRKF